MERVEDMEHKYINATKVQIVDKIPFGLIRVKITDTGETVVVDRMSISDAPDLTPSIPLGWFGNK